MKKIISRLNLLSLAALVAVALGCSTTKITQDQLSSAGFKKMPAKTAEQQAKLKTLPTDRLTMVQKDGKTYYVYPDAAHNGFLVGQEAQFNNYKRIQGENSQMNAETFSAAQSNGILDDDVGGIMW